MVHVGVVKWVGVGDVVAGLAVVDKIAGTAEVEEDGFSVRGGGGGVSVDAAETGGCNGGLKGGGAVDYDGVGGGEGGEFVVVVEGAVDDGGFAEVGEGGVEGGGAEVSGYRDVGVFLAEDFEESSCFIVRGMCPKNWVEGYTHLLPGPKRPRRVRKSCGLALDILIYFS